MEKEMLHRLWLLFMVLVLYHQCETSADVNNTAGVEIDGQYLLQMGKRFNKPALTLIGIAIRNLHLCGEWTSWTTCTARRLNYFGIRRRTRGCGVYMKINEAGKNKTEKDFSICEGTCRTDYSLSPNGFCYKVYTVNKNQEDASKQCQADGGNLINIDTGLKYGDVKNLTGVPATYMHIGGRRKDTSSPWEFSHGSQISFFKWESGEPDNASKDLCLVLKGSNKLMYDGFCSTARPFLCELSV